MPRDGSGVYTKPFPDVVTATTIASTVYNGFTNDIVTDLNTPRPVSAGGTGATTPAGALTALGGEKSGQVVTNYDSMTFLPGSFYSDAAATSPPVAGHAFVGICAYVDANNMYLEAFDRDDAAQPGAMWLRQKKAGVWSSWAKAQALNVVGTPAANAFTTWQSGTAIQGVAISGLVKGNGASAPTAAVAGTDFVAPDAELTAVAGAGSAADKLFYYTGAGTGALADFSAFGRSLVDDANAAAALTTLGAQAALGYTAMSTAGNQTVTGGFRITPSNQGTKSSGTFTPDAFSHNYQFYINGGAHTLAAPTSDCAMDILVTNNASAGAITFSGFTVNAANAGDPLTTTNTNAFIVSIRRINGVSTYVVKALQ